MTPTFDRSIDPAEFAVGEIIDQAGEAGLMLGFREGDTWTGYRLRPMTAIEIVRALSDWLDAHA